MAPDVPPLRLLRGDEAELFRTYEVALRAAVRQQAHTSEAIIDDACSIAWLKLMRRQPDRDTVFDWLRRVAIHEAWRLHAAAVRELPTDTIDHDLRPAPDDVATTAETRQLIQHITTLSPRQRRVLLLFLSGHTYKQIATNNDLSTNAVNKALVTARRHLRAVHDPN